MANGAVNPLAAVMQYRVDLRADHAEPVWIDKPNIARQAVTLFAGREGEGKSMVMQDTAIRLARPNDDNPDDYKDGYKVLLVDVENGARLIAERMHKLGLEADEKTAIRNISVFAPDNFDLANADYFMALQQMIIAAEPDVMIIDSLRSIYSQSLSSAKVKGMLESLRLLAERANMGIVLLHHTTKSGNTYLGSGAIGGTVEMVYFLLRHRDDPNPQRRVITCYKNRLTQEPDDIWLQISVEADGQVIQIEETDPFIEPAIGARNLLTTRIMISLIEKEYTDPTAPFLTMTEVCSKAGRKDKDATVRRIMHALVDLGHVQRTELHADPVTGKPLKGSQPRYVYRALTTDPDFAVNEVSARFAATAPDPINVLGGK